MQKLTYLSNSPACNNCDAYHCNRCVYKNFIGTGELNTPTKMQCTISYLERNYSAKLLERLKEERFEYSNLDIPAVDYSDPLERLAKKNKTPSVSLM